MDTAYAVRSWECTQGDLEEILGERGIRSGEDEPPSEEQELRVEGVECYSLSLSQPLRRLQPFLGYMFPGELSIQK